MLATRAVLHFARFWLKAVAELNMFAKLETQAVFQLLTSPLKADADWKAPTLRGKGNADKTKDLFVCSCGIAWRWRWRWHWTTEGSRTCWPLGRCSTLRGFG